MSEEYSDSDLVSLMASGFVFFGNKAITYLLKEHRSDIDDFLYKKSISEANDRESILHDAIVSLLLSCRNQTFISETENAIRKYLFVSSKNIMYKSGVPFAK